MARLSWGGVNNRYVELGVSKGVLYPKGKVGVPWNGLISVNESVSGAETVDLYADNMKYCTFRTAEQYEATIEAYTYPEEFGECDGSVALVQGVRVHQQTRLPFDLCYRTEVKDGNGQERADGYKLHLVYNATASPSEKSYETLNDSQDAITLSWDIITNPFLVDGIRPASTIVFDSTKIDHIKLEALEKILYGDSDTPPVMPDAATVIDLVKRLDLERKFIDIVSEDKLWIWDTFNFETDSVTSAIERESMTHIYYSPEAGTDFIQPSVAYALVSENDGVRKYSVIVIDDNNPSVLFEKISEEFSLTDSQTSYVGGRYYYRFDLYI